MSLRAGPGPADVVLRGPPGSFPEPLSRFLRSLLPVSPLFPSLVIQIRFQFPLWDLQKKSRGALPTQGQGPKGARWGGSQRVLAGPGVGGTGPGGASKDWLLLRQMELPGHTSAGAQPQAQGAWVVLGGNAVGRRGRCVRRGTPDGPAAPSHGDNVPTPVAIRPAAEQRVPAQRPLPPARRASPGQVWFTWLRVLLCGWDTDQCSSKGCPGPAALGEEGRAGNPSAREGQVWQCPDPVPSPSCLLRWTTFPSLPGRSVWPQACDRPTERGRQ